jgi:hypothetical protein
LSPSQHPASPASDTPFFRQSSPIQLLTRPPARLLPPPPALPTHFTVSSASPHALCSLPPHLLACTFLLLPSPIPLHLPHGLNSLPPDHVPHSSFAPPPLFPISPSLTSQSLNANPLPPPHTPSAPPLTSPPPTPRPIQLTNCLLCHLPPSSPPITPTNSTLISLFLPSQYSPPLPSTAHPLPSTPPPLSNHDTPMSRGTHCTFLLYPNAPNPRASPRSPPTSFSPSSPPSPSRPTSIYSRNIGTPQRGQPQHLTALPNSTSCSHGPT